MACSVTYVYGLAASSGSGATAATVATTSLALTGAGMALLGVASYLAVRQLVREYREASIALADRREADREYCESTNASYAAALETALQTVDHTSAAMCQDAMRDFLMRKITLLKEQIHQLPDPEGPYSSQKLRSTNIVNEATAASSGKISYELPGPNPHLLVNKAELLIESLTESSADLAAISAAYSELAGEVNASLPTFATSKSRAMLLDELVKFRQSIAESPLYFQEDRSICNGLLEQLTMLEKLPERQKKTAVQGLVLLSQRFNRELQLFAEREQKRLAKAEKYRSLVNDILARMKAVSQQELLPSHRADAIALLTNLSTVLPDTSIDNISRVEKLAAESERLYGDCNSALLEMAGKEFVEGQLKEAILSMGVPLRKEVDGKVGGNCVIAGFSPSLGIQFNFEGKQSIRAEMVAFSENAANVLPDTIEEGIAFADRVMQSVRERQCVVKERFRHLHKHPEGHHLRVVKVDSQQTQVLSKHEPKHMRMEK